MARHDFDPATVTPDGRAPARGVLFDAEAEGPWRGTAEGASMASGVTVLAYGTDRIGEGPRLHVHPYDETFVVLAGRARFRVGDAVIDASAGEIVFGPAGIPHSYANLGPGRLQTIDVHHSPRWIQTDLE